MYCLYKKVNSKFLLFCLATSLYSFLFLVGSITVQKNIQYFLQIILGFGISVFLFKNAIKNKKTNLDSDVKFVVYFFIFWGIVTAVRGFFSDSSFRGLVLCFSNPRTVLAYLMPLCVFFVVDNKKLFFLRNAWVLSFCVAVFVVYYFRNVLTVSSLNEFGSISDVKNHFYTYINIAQLLPDVFGFCAFFFIKGNFSKKIVRLMVFLAVVMSFVSPLLLGRRSSAFSVLFFLCLWGVLKLKKKKKWLIFFIVLFSLSYTVFFYYEESIMRLFPILFDRIGDDTRSWAMAEFYQSFEGDYLSYLIGRGSLGTYYSRVYGMRSIIETGWMDMILHGGVLLLFPYIWILALSFFRGFFCSEKLIVNAMALFLLAQLVFLYPSGHMSFDLRAVSIWICVACCLSRNVRKNGFL